ncbi:MAG: hypothetical protein IJS45_02115 [Clostridia bacterium]|nr:hypothetical protein [Clostridia bacterium]
MLKLIIGLKGTGKTKNLIELVNSAIDTTDGDVVCVEKGNKLRFDIRYQCRLIEADEFGIDSAASLYGFIAGLLASNNDIKHLFIDSAFKIAGEDIASFDPILDKIARLIDERNIECVITSSISENDATPTMKKYL